MVRGKTGIYISFALYFLPEVKKTTKGKAEKVQQVLVLQTTQHRVGRKTAEKGVMAERDVIMGGERFIQIFRVFTGFFAYLFPFKNHILIPFLHFKFIPCNTILPATQPAQNRRRAALTLKKRHPHGHRQTL